MDEMRWIQRIMTVISIWNLIDYSENFNELVMINILVL